MERMAPRRSTVASMPRPIAGRSARVAAVRRRPISLAGLSLVVALTALVGCGGSSSGNGVASKSPAEIIAAAKIGGRRCELGARLGLDGDGRHPDHARPQPRGRQGRPRPDRGERAELRTDRARRDDLHQRQLGLLQAFRGHGGRPAAPGEMAEGAGHQRELWGPLLADRTAQAARTRRWRAATRRLYRPAPAP